MAKVSVIVPVYNVETYIRRCIASLAGQTLTDIEVLLVDDGSTDGSGKICDEYVQKDPRFLVFHKQNGGVASARQFGLEKVTGEYTIHADADDWLELSMLEDLYTKAVENDADMVVCDYYADFPDRQEYKKGWTGADPANILADLLVADCSGALWNKLTRTSYMRKCDMHFGGGKYRRRLFVQCPTVQS